jgi:methionyl-tRNA formyltransferase
MKIAFIGAVEFSRQTLELLIKMKEDVVGVCTLKESPFNADHCDLAIICEKHDILWRYAPDINSEGCISWLEDKKPDVIFCFGWSKLLGHKILNLAPLGVIGFHPASLPANRGRHPLIWSLVLGLKETASTFFFMDMGADSGDILSQQKVEILDEDDATSLYEKITACALEQIKIFVPQLNSGSAPRTEQDSRQVNSWRKRDATDGQIDWRMSARSIRNLVRGLAKPYIGAHFICLGKEIKVWKVRVVDEVQENMEPGKIVAIKKGKAVVKCGEQAIQLLVIEPEIDLSCDKYL